MQAVMPGASDGVIAELLEHICQARDAAEACALVLERAFAEVGLERGIALMRSESQLHGGGIGLPDRLVSAFLAGAADPDVSVYLDFYSSSTWRGKTQVVGSFLGLDECVMVPIEGPHGTPIGTVVVEAAPDDDRVATVVEIFRRCSAALARCLQVQLLDGRVEKLSRQRDLLTTIIDGLPDPVLLTSADNQMMLANQRAERLFTASADDSEGRKRAIQINTLLFSSSLTRAIIGTPGATSSGRELNLVDPSDGSDLVFELLPFPRRPRWLRKARCCPFCATSRT